MGADVDAHDAYLYFDKSEYELLGTGAISPFAVSGYLKDQGLNSLYTKWDMVPNGTYITCYVWSDGKGMGCHYQCFSTNENSLISGYNPHKGDNLDYNSYSNKNFIAISLGTRFISNQN